MPEYTMTFAGVPFLLDVGEAVVPPPGEGEDSPLRSRELAALTPEGSFRDLIERLVPTHYLRDFLPPADYPGPRLGHLARLPQVGLHPDATVRVGDLFYPTGACRWGVFRGLATSSMMRAMLSGSVRGRGTFTMTAEADGPRGDGLASAHSIETEMYMLPPRPIAEHGGGADGLYLITLVDERFFWRDSPVLLDVDASTTWASLIASLASALGVGISHSAIPEAYGRPSPDSQLWARMESAAALLDAVALNVGRTLVRRLDGSFVLLTPAESKATVDASRGSPLKVVRRAGGDLFMSGVPLPAGDLSPAREVIVPAAITVSFPRYALQPTPHFVGTPSLGTAFGASPGDVFSVEVPIASGGNPVDGLTGTGQWGVRDTSLALYTLGGDAHPLNASGLTALAMEVARDLYARQVLGSLDEVHEGIIDWAPEGLHDIIWSYSDRMRGACTRIMRAPWNANPADMQHGTLAPAGTTVPGGGGLPPSQTWTDGDVHQQGTTLAGNLTAGGMLASLSRPDYLPTSHRWKGLVEDEVILFEGTSGGTSVGVVSRAVDGTTAAAHPTGVSVTHFVPNVTHNVGAVSFGPMQFAYTREFSPGLRGVQVVPQTQSVVAHTDEPVRLNDIDHYSGSVLSYDPARSSGSQFVRGEDVWLVERNGRSLVSGVRYDGQVMGYSASETGEVSVAPVYAVNIGGGNFFFDFSQITIDVDVLNDTDVFINEGPYVDIITNVNIVNITGIVAQPGRILFLHNKGPGLMKLFHEDPNSEEANRIITWTRSEQVYAECQTAILYYTPNLNRWLVLTASNAYEWWDQDYRTFAGGLLDPGQYTAIGISPSKEQTIISGITAREHGSILLLWNVSSDIEITLEHSGSAPTGILCPDNKNHIIKRGEFVLLIYEGLFLQWTIALTSALMGASGPKSQRGLVPTPPLVSGTTLFLREDATWAVPKANITTIEHDPANPILSSPVVSGVNALRFVRYEDEDAFFTGLTANEYVPTSGDPIVGVVKQTIVEVEGFSWTGTWVTEVICSGGALGVTTVDVEFKNGLLKKVE